MTRVDFARVIAGCLAGVALAACSAGCDRPPTAAPASQPPTDGPPAAAAAGQPLTEHATLRGHEGKVFCVAIGPDGRALASGGEDQTARLWDLSTAKESATLPGHNKSVFTLAWSSNGKALATGDFDGTVKLWNPESGGQVRTLVTGSNKVQGVALTADGKILAVGCNDALRVWDVAAGTELTKIPSKLGSVGAVSFSPDGHTLAAAGAMSRVGGLGAEGPSFDGVVNLYDPNLIGEPEVLPVDFGIVRSIAFSPDGTLLAAGGGRAAQPGGIVVWDVATKARLATLFGHSYPVTSVCFSPDSALLATAGAEGMARVWDVASSRTVASADLASVGIFSVAFTPNGKTIVGGCADGAIRMWAIPAGK